MKKNLSLLFVKIFFGSLMLIGPSIALMNFIGDPIQFYRRSEGKKLFGQSRWQIAGFIKNFDYDLVVVGSSMTENFSPKFISQHFPSKPILLSMAGSSTHEQTIVLKKALETGKVRTVIWGIDQSSLSYTDNALRPTFPKFLYEDSMMTHLQYLFNFEILVDSFLMLIRQKILHVTQMPDAEALETYMNWQDKFVFSKDVILGMYKKHNVNENVHASVEIIPSLIETRKANFLKDVLSLVKKYPQVKFYIFLPPYSLAQYKINYYNDPRGFESSLKFREILFESLMPLANVAVYDFETDLNIVTNLNNYKDLMHHSKFINDEMILKMRNHINRVTPNNIQEKNAVFRKQVLLPLE